MRSARVGELMKIYVYVLDFSSLSFSLDCVVRMIQMDRVATQQLVTAEWENGFVQCSAKENENVTQVGGHEVCLCACALG